MRRLVKVTLAVSTLALVAFGLLVYWIFLGHEQYYAAKATLAHSTLARSLRCHGISRPRLASAPADWKLEYSWVGGYGLGDVWFKLSADGTAVLHARPHQGNDHSATVILTSEQVRRIASAVDNSGLLCLDPIPREGYVVEDLGRYSVQVSAPGYSKTVYIDKCTTVRDSRAFAQVISEIAGMKRVLGEFITWGPTGMYSGPGSCVHAS